MNHALRHNRAPIRDKLFAALVWLSVATAASFCSAEIARLVELPNRAVGNLLDGILPIVLVLAGAALLVGIWRRLDARHWTTWWDPAARPDGEIGWDDVRCLVLQDPLEHVPRLRLRYLLERTPIYALYLAFAVAVVWFLLCLIDQAWLPGLLDARTGAGQVFANLVKPSENLTAYLALIAATVSILFAYIHLRAKVRADNRQAWIDRARSHLGIVTSLGSLHSYVVASEAPDLWLKFAPLRLELELMLNSSEKDHRLLEFLLHELAILREEDKELIDDSEHLKLAIERTSDIPFADWLPRYDHRVQLITYILRLSHVVLKREWERVKQTR